MLVVFGGLPGVGKTTLSRQVAQRLGATWLRVDALEAAMWRVGLPRDGAVGLAAYSVAHAAAAGQLALGGLVVVDAVNPVEEARQGWRDLAAAQDVPLRLVEVVCSDEAEHRRRVEQRRPEPDQPTTPTWSDVAGLRYDPWHGDRLTVDAAAGSDGCVDNVLAYCGR
ncbi:adenylyl-sulfate kinase [Catellatospora sp. TT07R-123]|uniref:AAA family ATPase n=1 Tax=Catellatospora sp. TT07R-123 TaxID=2733863 RepID=UPI001B131C04|nr:ATP-binding protein [Catellatospora sp. TT07R-123]GHJ47423.1 adenylyl-sulfate kinase [Catellatospora sp. TT07R-123]